MPLQVGGKGVVKIQIVEIKRGGGGVGFFGGVGLFRFVGFVGFVRRGGGGNVGDGGGGDGQFGLGVFFETGVEQIDGGGGGVVGEQVLEIDKGAFGGWV